jgi:hypothetical protein
MEKRIVILLTARALSDLQKIKNFNDELYGFDKSKEIIESVFKTIEILQNPNYDYEKIVLIDDDFKHLKDYYRKLIDKHY